MLADRLPFFASELLKIGSGAIKKAAAEEVSLPIGPPPKLTPAQKAARHFESMDPNWKAFEKNLRSKKFQGEVRSHPMADDKLKKYVKNYGGYVLSKDEVAQLKSKDSGKTYRIKDLHNGRYACGCKDWQYKRSVGGGDCKHIKSLKQSKMVKESFVKSLLTRTGPIVAGNHLRLRSAAKKGALANEFTHQMEAADMESRFGAGR